MSDQEQTKCVKWGDLTINEHTTILGDNPAVKSGPPLTIDWKSHQFRKLSIDKYEYFRETQNFRRSRPELRLDAGERNSLLLCKGYTMSELIRSAVEAESIRKSRRANVKTAGRFDSFRKVLAKTTKTVQNTPSLFTLMNGTASSPSSKNSGKEPSERRIKRHNSSDARLPRRSSRQQPPGPSKGPFRGIRKAASESLANMRVDHTKFMLARQGSDTRLQSKAELPDLKPCKIDSCQQGPESKIVVAASG